MIHARAVGDAMICQMNCIVFRAQSFCEDSPATSAGYEQRYVQRQVLCHAQALVSAAVNGRRQRRVSFVTCLDSAEWTPQWYGFFGSESAPGTKNQLAAPTARCGGWAWVTTIRTRFTTVTGAEPAFGRCAPGERAPPSSARDPDRNLRAMRQRRRVRTSPIRGACSAPCQRVTPARSARMSAAHVHEVQTVIQRPVKDPRCHHRQ